MSHVRNCLVMVVLLVPSLGIHARAQIDELLPEIDLYYKLNSDMRVSFQAKETREDGTPITAEIGPSLDFYLKPLPKLVDMVPFGLDDSKSQQLVLSVGYRYLPTPGQVRINRLEPVATLNFLLGRTRVLLSDRNRGDLDWQSGRFSWRYRNRVQLERKVTIHSYRLSPYASAEFFYNSLYGKWSDTAIYGGCILPIRKHVEFNPYYEHQNNTGSSPNQQFNQLGLMVSLYVGR
jgi:Protein of unknown function (DUF2490)